MSSSAKKSVHTKCSGLCGCCNGDTAARHSKPTDPEWFGKGHWPTALPHEKDFGSRCHDDARRHVPAEISDANGNTTAQAIATSTTGLLTREDFMAEIDTLGVSSEELISKINRWFNKLEEGECGQGLARMQSNNLLRNAVKRKESADGKITV